MRMIRVAGIAAAVILAAGCAGGGHRLTAAQRHYFNLGKRACGTQRPSPLFNPVLYPPNYRNAVIAGCSAAVGQDEGAT